jgi:hypothetical protein
VVAELLEHRVFVTQLAVVVRAVMADLVHWARIAMVVGALVQAVTLVPAAKVPRHKIVVARALVAVAVAVKAVVVMAVPEAAVAV